MIANDGFVYRHNIDGTLDAICPKCYATVAKCGSLAALVKGQQLHVCYVSETYVESATIARMIA
jgi:hypothetical protein